MASAFTPPGIHHVTEIDRTDCEYSPRSIEIHGVISPTSQGGWPCDENYKVHCFTLAAWRRVGEAVVESEMTILRPIPSKNADCWSDFPAHSVHRLQLILSKDETRAIFSGESSPIDSDQQLTEIAEKLREPVVIFTSSFGELTLDRRVGWFEGEANWNGRLVRITFERDATGTIEIGLNAAEKLWRDAEEWKRSVDNYAVQKLLPLKNKSWLDEDEEPLSPAQFKEQMTLQDVGFKRDGSFDFWHDDGDLFWGHLIQISGSLEKGLTNADIPG